MTYRCTNRECQWTGDDPPFNTFDRGEFRGFLCPDCGAPVEDMKEEVMDKDERNKIMDDCLDAIKRNAEESFACRGDFLRAIRECDKLARAWNKLEEYLEKHKWPTIQNLMQTLLSPTPKDPLED